MKWWKRIVWGLLIGGVIFFGFRELQQKEKTRLIVGEEVIDIEIASSVETRAQGLSGRGFLGENEGMLFEFERPGNYSFWMKGMNFDLDFIWINKGVVIEVTEKVGALQVNEKPVTVSPSKVVDWVLEVNSGWVERHEVKLGDKVRLVE